MIPPHRAAEANYYEEFGIEPSASPAQVRDAFRALVRILHPDQLTDPDLKGIAERKLRRMNAIYEVLSDAERRRAYDASLRREYREPYVAALPAYRREPRRFVNGFLWAGVMVMLAGTSVWLYFDSLQRTPTVTAVPERVVAAARQPEETRAASYPDSLSLEALRNDLRDALAERDAARKETARLRALLDERDDTAPETPPAKATASGAVQGTAAADPPATLQFSPLPAKPASVPAVIPAVHTASPKPLGSDPHQFAGFWFYAQGTERADKSLYLPEFIEAALTEHNGVIQGRYRSRYQIADRAIPPDVNFEFTGTAAGATLTAPWAGWGGAKGKVSLRLTDENTLKFVWTASRLGSSQGLTAGTATLTRRIE